MSEMVERIAKAIEATMFAPHELPVTGELHTRYLETARAAITALREPTPAMSEAGRQSRILTHTDYVEDIWRAMIDEAGRDAEAKVTG